MKTALSTWENEGGAVMSANVERRSGPLYGTDSQVEWAEVIRVRVDEEFDRIAAAFRSVAAKQPFHQRAETEGIIAILEEKRCEVLSIEQAGTFIRDWRELGDQVRRMILNDPRYQAIQATRVKAR